MAACDQRLAARDRRLAVGDWRLAARDWKEHSGSTGRVALSIIGDSSQAFSPFRAEVAELADAQASGACGRKVVEVQILSSAYLINSTRCRDVSLRFRRA